MKLDLFRHDTNAMRTIGKMSIDGSFFCYTLEDAIRPIKIAGITAIPYGKYQVVLTESQRFKKLLPLLLSVPNFEGIRIHGGNRAADTEGCILVGFTRGIDSIHDSQRAVNTLIADLTPVLAKGEEVWLEIHHAEGDVPEARQG